MNIVVNIHLKNLLGFILNISKIHFMIVENTHEIIKQNINPVIIQYIKSFHKSQPQA